MRSIVAALLAGAILLPAPALADAAEDKFPDRPGMRGKMINPKGQLPGFKALFGRKSVSEAAALEQKEPGMERVTGIGGFFFRAKDPEAVAAWYRDNLGIDLVPGDYDTPPWQQAAGATVFAPFAHDTDYFGEAEQQWMLNFRVRDLDAMVAQLRANGNAVTVDETAHPNGRFARVHDPEGNPIELWEPGGMDKSE